MKKYLFYAAVIVSVAIVFFVGICPFRGQKEEYTYKVRRKEMVQVQIASRGVKDEKVLDAMGAVLRHKFVSEDLVGSAYEDRPLPIGCGQTISQPYIVALMTELLNVDKKDKVLEVGTGDRKSVV